MNKLGLRSRLFLSHLLVMVVGVGSLVTIGKFSSPQFFIRHLEQQQGTRFGILRYSRTELIQVFETAWASSTFWSVLAGASAAGGLSYWVSLRIMKPLTHMERITQKFAAGQLKERLPTTDIPELNQLSLSFNQMAQNLEGVEHRRRELISDLTHELRTPLTVVRGYLEELTSGDLAPSREIYDRLVRETRRLERLVNDLQLLSKAEAGYLPIKLQPVDLRPLLCSLVERFGDQLLEQGPTLKLDCPETLPKAFADLDRTEQILVNLLGNAVQYTPQGQITLKAWSETGRSLSKLGSKSAHQSSGRLWIAVRDTGIGIDSKDLPNVFERFWRADPSRSRQSGGTGIGLAITRRLVELQNGQIQVESKLGQGSTFKFYLPLAS